MREKILSAFILLLFNFSIRTFAQSNQAITDKLSIITSLTVNDSYVQLPEDSILRKYLKIELIKEEDFQAKQKTAINHLLADTGKIRKKKGVLRLPLATGSKTLVDKLVDNDGRQEYEYLGQITFLNAYLVRCLFWEVMEYRLISKKNGTTISTFSAMPYISADKKKIMTAYADPYENDSEIAVYSITGNKINNTILARFKNWMPGNEEKIFWGADGKLYLPVQFSDQFWNTDGNLNTNFFYLRINL
ncbi:MAG: hypothetical protein H7Y01_04815 [Ferruginibacter sp.]|nr:hypothetical protein [Chitinophagaceae bacterium]